MNAQKNKNRKTVLAVGFDDSKITLAQTMLETDSEIIYTESGTEALDHVVKGFVPNQIFFNTSTKGISEREDRNKLKGIGLLKDIPVVVLPT